MYSLDPILFRQANVKGRKNDERSTDVCQYFIVHQDNTPVYFSPPYTSLLYEPRCEKTCLLDLRPGPPQTGLCSHRRVF